jgi:hypothetical protein
VALIEKLTDSSYVECPDGVVQVVFTRGVAESMAGCRLKQGSPRIYFIGNLGGRPLQHVCTLTLKQLNFGCSFLHSQVVSCTGVKTC